MLVKGLLNKSEQTLISITPENTIGEAADMLTANNIGTLPVCDQSGDLVGIISERDIIRGFSKQSGAIGAMNVSELMTKNVITCNLDDNVNDTMGTMDEKKVRHLPVLNEGKLFAVISSRDIMAYVLEETRNSRDLFSNAYEMHRVG